MMKKKILCLLFLMILLTSANSFAEEKLIFAVDLVRHGDRTPTYQIPKSYILWKEGLGELTAQGINHEIQLGEQLRKNYINRYHLLPKIYDPNSIYVRSTNFNRTIKSADSLLLGLYPINVRPLLNQKIPICAVPNAEDNLLVVKPNRNIFSLINRYVATHKDWKEKTINLQDQLKYWSKETGLPLNNFQQLDRLADNLYVRKLNHISLPKGISSRDADKIILLSESEIISEFKLKDVTHPMGREFLKTVSNYLEQAIQHKTSLKYVLLSGHDSSIMSVMNTLESPLEKIPGYASDLNFSLFESNKKYYVKVSFNNKPVNIPACGGSTCTISQFNDVGQA